MCPEEATILAISVNLIMMEEHCWTVPSICSEIVILFVSSIYIFS